MPTSSVEKQQSDRAEWLREVARAVGGLRYGSVEVLVHDGRVVQIETREKVRFEDRAHRKAGGSAANLNLETNE